MTLIEAARRIDRLVPRSPADLYTSVYAPPQRPGDSVLPQEWITCLFLYPTCDMSLLCEKIRELTHGKNGEGHFLSVAETVLMAKKLHAELKAGAWQAVFLARSATPTDWQPLFNSVASTMTRSVICAQLAEDRTRQLIEVGARTAEIVCALPI